MNNKKIFMYYLRTRDSNFISNVHMSGYIGFQFEDIIDEIDPHKLIWVGIFSTPNITVKTKFKDKIGSISEMVDAMDVLVLNLKRYGIEQIPLELFDEERYV